MALPGDLAEDEWAVLEPVLPPASRFGRPRKWPLRRLVDAMFCLRGGLPWRMLPQGFPPMTASALPCFQHNSTQLSTLCMSKIWQSFFNHT